MDNSKKERLKEYHRLWHQKTKEKRKMLIRKNLKNYNLRHPEKVKKRLSDWYARNKEKVYEYNKKWRLDHIDYYRKRQNCYAKKYQTEDVVKRKQRIRFKTLNLIKNGRLKRKLFCEKCGSKGTIHAHHKTYTPVDVIFVCSRCHGELHRLFIPFSC